MKIAVCIKQVPDTEAVIKLAPDQKSIVLDGLKLILNPYDEFAVEQALRTKEAKGGETVVITVGPTKAIDALRTAMAMGIDRAIHIVEEAAQELDVATSAALAAKKLAGEHFDLIFTGVRAVDDDVAQFTQILAELLALPHVTQVSAMEVGEGVATVTRDVEGGTKEVWKVNGPFVCAVTKGINEPRYASLPGIMKAKKKPVDTVAPSALGFAADYRSTERRVSPCSYATPPERKAGTKIDGADPSTAADKIVEFMQREARII